MAPTLDVLPREILQQILSYLTYRDVVSCSLVSRGLADVCDAPLLWRGLCVDEYVSWHADHCIEERLGRVDVLDDGARVRKRSVLDTDWKQLFALRKMQDRRFGQAFERVLSRQDGRIDVVAQITSRREDARDFLERVKTEGERRCYRDFNDHFQRQARSHDEGQDEDEGKAQQDSEDDDDDSLARAFWANEMLGSINRAQALREITNVITAPRRRQRERVVAAQQKRQEQEQQDYPLINALWAIDYFVAESPPETLPQMLTHLDNIAAGFRKEYPDCFSTTAHDAFSPSSSPVMEEKRRASYASGAALPGGRTRRQRALCLAEFVREHDLVGVRSPETYHDLQNSLVSVALCDKDHPSLPLVGHAIYCALAERVGLIAGLTNTPRHVYVTIKAPEGTTLDDEIAEDDPGDDEGQTFEQQHSAAAISTPDNESSHGPDDELAPTRTIFLDPFHHEGEVPLAQLRSLYTVGMGGGGGGGVNGLLGFASLLQNSRPDHMPTAGPTAAELAASLAPASTRDMMFRMARNLQETLRGSVHSLAYRTALTDPTDEFVEHLPTSRGGQSVRAIRPTLLNPYRAGYCAWWLQTLLDEIGGLQHRALYNFVEGFMHNFKETDCPLVVEYMLAAFNGGFMSGPGVGGGEDVLGAAAEVGRDEAAFIETVLAHVRREDGRITVAKRRHPRPDAQKQEKTEAKGREQSNKNEVDLLPDVAATHNTGTSASEPQPPAEALYRVGDLFRHRRYRYRAVITGWDATCQASEQWMQQMGVDALPHGRSQSFYHVLVEDHSTRYVAQENIDVITPVTAADAAAAARRRREGRARSRNGGEQGAVGGGNDTDGVDSEDEDDDDDEDGEDGDARRGMADELSRAGPPLDILRIAGRYFKRWDAAQGRFVSNVRDEYPDD